MTRPIFAVAALSACCTIGPAPASGDDLFARGINLASAALHDEHSPGVYGQDYIYPSAKHLDYYANKGFAVVRLPYRWERLQRSLFGDLDRLELQRIRDFVAAARVRGMRVILSPHNFGRYRLHGVETLIGTAAVPIAAFADFSHKVAAAFRGDEAVYALSLMNEPHDSQGLWKRTAQAALDAVRAADRDRLVLAPGDQWSEAFRWQRYNADFLLNDPSARLVYEAHQYFDADHTGSYKTSYRLSGASPNRGIDWIKPFVEWLRRHHQKGLITEFGVPNNDKQWLDLLERLLAFLAAEKISWTYWAGGPWWGNYRLSTEPANGVDQPVMSVLTKDYGLLPR